MNEHKKTIHDERPKYFFKEWRKFRNLTQEVLAERIQVKAASISQLESGKQGFTNSTLEAIATALDCTVVDLLGRDPLETSIISSIVVKLNKLPSQNLRQVNALIDSMIESNQSHR